MGSGWTWALPVVKGAGQGVSALLQSGAIGPGLARAGDLPGVLPVHCSLARGPYRCPLRRAGRWVPAVVEASQVFPFHLNQDNAG